MMSAEPSLVVSGTLTLDTTERAGARHVDIPGGSALYAAAAARLLLPTRLLGLVGTDFPLDDLAPLWQQGVDAAHLEIEPGRTFRWHARYTPDGNGRETLARDPGVTQTQTYRPAPPPPPPTPYGLLLGSMDPRVQTVMRNAHPDAALVGLDSMMHWWTDHGAVVRALLPRVDVLFVDVAELALASGTDDLRDGVTRLLQWGPPCVVVKHGSRGAWMQRRDQSPMQVTAYPIGDAVDTTGAGDAFAGAWLGSQLIGHSDATTLAYATTIASSAVAGVGISGLMQLSERLLQERLAYRAPVRTGAITIGI